jgi:hypothetical protein
MYFVIFPSVADLFGRHRITDYPQQAQIQNHTIWKQDDSPEKSGNLDESMI